MATQMTDAFDVQGLVEQRKELEQLMLSNPKMEKQVQKLIRKVLMQARAALQRSAKSPDMMKADPRQAYKAIRATVYRQILGGNVNILSKKRAGNRGTYQPTVTLKSGQRGGNRRPRSERTKNLQSYWGSDRGFILRFLNAGTEDRAINFVPDEARAHVHRGSQGGRKYGKTINTGRRGKIMARNWFGSASQQKIENAAQNLTNYIDELIKNEMR